MSEYVSMEFCALPATPFGFDEKEFKEGNPKQISDYKRSKTPNRKKILTYEQISDETKPVNYARVVPKGCCFIDYDDPDQAETMKNIILNSGLKCLILKTMHGYHFLFRIPDFYDKELTGATNWFGYKFDTKATTEEHDAVQIMRACSMEREERMSWNWDAGPVIPESINIEVLDILPYWLWGKDKDKELHKKGKPGDRDKEDPTEYTLTDTPFTRLMKMSDGGRHDHIVKRCSYFALSNGFFKEEFRSIITAIHDEFLVKIGTPMSDLDLFGDLDKRWSEYEAMLISSSWEFREKERKWIKLESKAEKLDERHAAAWLFKQYDFYGRNRMADGKFDTLLYKTLDGPYEYVADVTKIRKTLKDYSDQNFKEQFFKEVETQLMQMCAENDKTIQRNDKYVIVKNKVLSCVSDEAFDFSWIGKRPPTDVVFPWNWYSREWVAEHEEDLGSNINWFIEQLSRNSLGRPQKFVQDWLWVVAGACMIPANQLQKIIVLAGGGQNGKSLYFSLIKLCIGDEMFNESKIFSSDPHDSFWGENLDHGILCVIDDLEKNYNRNAFSYIKGAITATDSVVINEKFKAKRPLDVLPQIVVGTNEDFELYDKSEGMKRRVKILPTEYHVPDSVKDGDLEYKLVLNTLDRTKVAAYKMSEDSFAHQGVKAMHMYTKEKGVLDSLKDGSLAWFANKARYKYLDWILGLLILEDSEAMRELMEGAFSGGFDEEITEFLEWYLKERGESIWTKDLYVEYQDWHNEKATGDTMMKEKAFSMRLGKAIGLMQAKGYRVDMRKMLNDKRISLNKLCVNED